jgi:tetratricopeptide (TPR) repeat protein
MHAHRALILLSLLFPAACTRSQPPAPPAAGSAFDEVVGLVRQKDYAQAAQKLEQMRAARGDDPEVIVRLAEVWRVQGEQAKAILLLRETLEKQPGAKILYVPLANLYLTVGTPKEARAVLEKGRAAGADSGDLSLALGICLGRLDESEAALAEFDRALAGGAERKLVLYNRGLVLGQLKRNPEARAAFEEVVRLDPTWAPGRRELARAILDGLPRDPKEVGRALDILVEVREKLPEDYRVDEAIGDAWLMLGDYDAALQAYTDALAKGKNPKSVEDRYRVAKLKQMDAQKQAGGGPAPAADAAQKPH